MKDKVYIFIAVFIMTAIVASQAYAMEQKSDDTEDFFEMSLEELMEVPIVSSTGFFAMSAKKAPGYTTVLNLKKIENSPARTLEDLLAFYAPGIHIGRHERHGTLIGTRGILIDNNAKTLVMLDGQQLNQRSHFGFTVPLQSPLIGDLEAIEIINGPGAIVHGSGAINGFINLVPKSGEEHPGLFADYEYGVVESSKKEEVGWGISYGKNRSLFLYGGLVSANGTTRDTSWDSPDEVAHKDYKVYGSPHRSYKTSSYLKHDDLSLNVLLQETNIHHGGDVDDALHKDAGFHHGILAVRPKYMLNLSDTESVELIGSVELSESWTDRKDTWGNIAGGAERHEEFKLVARTTRFNNHSLAGGFLLGKRDFYSDKSWFHEDLDWAFETIDLSWKEKAYFIEDVFALSDKWTFSAGGRLDEVDYGDYGEDYSYIVSEPEDIKETTMRLACSYQHDPETVWKLSYQQGFRSPDACYYNDNYLGAPLNTLGFSMPKLEPEQMQSFEMNFSKIFPKKKLRVDLNAYYNIYDKMLSWHDFYEGDGFYPAGVVDAMTGVSNPGSPGPYVLDWGDIPWWFGSFVNAKGPFRSYGGEVVVNWEKSEKTNVEFIYGYSKPHKLDKVTNANISNPANDHRDEWIRYPTHQIKTSITSLFLNDKLAMNLSMLYNSDYETGGTRNVHKIYGKSRLVFNLMAKYSFKENMFVKFGVHNLFGEDVPPIAYDSASPYSGNIGVDKRYYYIKFGCRF